MPSFTKPGSQLDFYKMFNARSESVAEKPVFSRLLSSHRCVVITEGFYEWKTDAGATCSATFDPPDQLWTAPDSDNLHGSAVSTKKPTSLTGPLVRAASLPGPLLYACCPRWKEAAVLHQSG